MYDVFIAHAGPDELLADALYLHLEERVDCFLATKKLLPGDEWDQAIVDAQRSALITAVLITKNSDASFYQREEVAAAISFSRAAPESHRVIPLICQLHDDIPPPIPYGLRLKHALVVRDEDDISRRADKIVETLNILRARRQATTFPAREPAGERVRSARPAPALFAFLVALDISNFSRFTADEQLAAYTTLRLAISEALADLELEIARTTEGKVFWSQGGDGGILSTVGGDARDIFRATLLAFSSLRSRIASDSCPPFSVVGALPRGTEVGLLAGYPLRLAGGQEVIR